MSSEEAVERAFFLNTFFLNDAIFHRFSYLNSYNSKTNERRTLKFGTFHFQTIYFNLVFANLNCFFK